MADNERGGSGNFANVRSALRRLVKKADSTSKVAKLRAAG
jgi:hypothetical protein